MAMTRARDSLSLITPQRFITVPLPGYSSIRLAMAPRMSVRRRVIHTTADGRRLLVVHGDDYDSQTQFGGFQEALGDWLYERILTGNRLANALRRRFGLRYWSLADFLKRQSGAAERYIARFIDAGLEDVRRRGLDGIVCGHIHRPALVEREGLVYANDGDWVESLTALVEDADGTLRLLDHRGETLERLGPRVCWIDDRRLLPTRAARPAVLPEAA